jgi:ABC-2 type transport system permease protein
MLRYLRLYVCFLRFSFSRAMEFRVDFFFRIVMDAIWYAVQLFMFWVFYLHTETLGGWTFDQILVFAAAYMLIDAVHMTFFSNNIWSQPALVNRGDLDYAIVRPVSSLFFVSLRDFAVNSSLNLLMAIGIVVWAIGRYPSPIDGSTIVLFGVLLTIGCIINYIINMMLLIPVFWIHSERGMNSVYFSLSHCSEHPHQIYTGWVRRLFTTILPLALISSFPTHVLFDGLTLERALHVGLVVIGGFALLLFCWGRGLRAYSSASS